MSGLDLFLSQQVFARMLLFALLAGVAAGILYDGFCVIRLFLCDPTVLDRNVSPVPAHTIPHSIVRFVLDFMFVISTAIILILLCYYTNDGQLRAPAIIGMACGFFVYKRLISPWILRLAALLHHATMTVLRFVWRHTGGRIMASIRNLYNRSVEARRRKQIPSETGETSISVADRHSDE